MSSYSSGHRLLCRRLPLLGSPRDLRRDLLEQRDERKDEEADDAPRASAMSTTRTIFPVSRQTVLARPQPKGKAESPTCVPSTPTVSKPSATESTEGEVWEELGEWEATKDAIADECRVVAQRVHKCLFAAAHRCWPKQRSS